MPSEPSVLHVFKTETTGARRWDGQRDEFRTLHPKAVRED